MYLKPEPPTPNRRGPVPKSVRTGAGTGPLLSPLPTVVMPAPSQFLDAEDRALCQRVADQVTADAKWYSTSIDKHVLASTILSLFQHGVVNEANLLAHVRARRHDFTKHTG
ncbi:conserved hypothetical protein [Mesorhizobium metallidurans STM 2683]|uniref:Uncharacterized protein n=1 Tax=Mesorhizobium metallidurans STM 2683 TaxID=1297569 RepID=M5EPN5_9HYPH|nr:hypothetical protein [Mesorhizobium metallidurans]CCV06110.1 conserved hypothetical protein [Mesorhizobium metallidurans STM 2683]